MANIRENQLPLKTNANFTNTNMRILESGASQQISAEVLLSNTLQSASKYGISPSNPNNSPALQAFINNTSNPDSLFFPKGTYNFTDPIVVSRPITIQGEGIQSTNFHFAAQATSNGWAFDCTANTATFKELRVIYIPGRTYLNSPPNGRQDDGRNFGCFRFARDSKESGQRSVTGVLIDNVTIEGFSGYGVAVHMGINFEVHIALMRWCLGARFFDHKNRDVNNSEEVNFITTTGILSGYLTGCPRGWDIERCTEMILNNPIAEYCGVADKSYGGINIRGSRRVTLMTPYGESNTGPHLVSTDSRITNINPAWYTQTNPAMEWEIHTYSGMAVVDRASVRIDSFGVWVVPRAGATVTATTNGLVRLGLSYPSDNSTTLLGAGFYDGTTMQTLRTTSNNLFNTESTDANHQGSRLQVGNFTYGTAVGSKVYGTAIAAGLGDTGTRHGAVFGCERTNSTLSGFNFYISSLVRGSAPVDRVGMTDTGHWYPVVTGSQDLGRSANRWATAFITRLDIPSNGSARMPTGTTDPASPVSGEFYFNTSTNVLRIHNGSGWRSIATT